MSSLVLPVLERLDLVLDFARVAPRLDACAAIARERGLRVSEVEPGLGTIRGDRFVLMFDGDRLARVHVAGLFEDPEEDAATSASLGVAVTSDCDALEAAFERTKAAIGARLGAPSEEGQWEATCLLHDEPHTYRFAAWVLDATVLVLLLDEEGDAHVGELAALDLRIAPRSVAGSLPDPVRRPFAGPFIEDA